MSINQRGNLPVILGVLILLIVVGGGAYFLGIKQRFADKIQENDTNINSSQNPIVSPSQASNAGANTEPVQIQNTQEANTYTIQALSFNVPLYWWSRSTKISDNLSEGFSLNPAKMCWACDEQPAISIWFHPNTTLADKKSEIIKYTYLEKVSEKNISVPNGTGVLIEGTINPSEDVPLAKGDIDRTVFFQKGQDLYTLHEHGESYKKEFEQTLSSFKFTN